MASSRSCSSLPEDVLIEIFNYLPLASIYRSKSVSKVWLSILSNPNFITRWFQINNKSVPWIHYHSIVRSYRDAFDEDQLSLGNAYPDSQLISRNDYGFSFEFLRNEKSIQGAKLYPLGCSNGLVLCYSLHSDDDQRKYHVCNPLTQKWVTLPSQPSCVSRTHNVSGVFCENPFSANCCYTIVLIPRFHCLKLFNIDVFCSDLGEWRSFEVSCDHSVSEFTSSNENAIIVDGILFWLGRGDQILVYNLNQNKSDGHRCSLLRLPFPRYFKGFGWDGEVIFISHTLGESEGCLCYARTRLSRRRITISVWMLDAGNWQLLHKNISVHDTLAEMCCLTCGVGCDIIRVLGFSPVDRNVVLLGNERWVWWYNIQTRRFEELAHSSSLLTDKRLYSRYVSCVLKTMPTVLPLPSWIDT